MRRENRSRGVRGESRENSPPSPRRESSPGPTASAPRSPLRPFISHHVCVFGMHGVRWLCLDVKLVGAGAAGRESLRRMVRQRVACDRKGELLLAPQITAAERTRGGGVNNQYR